MSLIYLFIGFAIGNFFVQFVRGGDWEQAIDRTVAQAMAIAATAYVLS